MPRFFQTQIRTTDHENTDSTRDWLHDADVVAFPHRTAEDAEASCAADVQEECDFRTEQYEEGEWSYRVEQTYDAKQGGGFWFSLWCDGEMRAEGRVLVRSVVVPE